jgi:hypothetical protein
VTQRIAWEWNKLRRRLSGEAEPAAPAQFHSAAIEQAFRRACDVYLTPNYDGRLVLFRPKLKPTHVFGPNRMINVDRRFIFPDNGWSQHVADVEVHEVPGDHDSMVLEPNVRVLGARLRQAINFAEAQVAARNRKQETLLPPGEGGRRPDEGRSASAIHLPSPSSPHPGTLPTGEGERIMHVVNK